MIISLEVEISRVVVQRIHQNSKMAASSEYFLSEGGFEDALTTFCCCD